MRLSGPYRRRVSLVTVLGLLFFKPTFPTSTLRLTAFLAPFPLRSTALCHTNSPTHFQARTTFTDILTKLGFSQCSVNQAIYHKSDTAARELVVIAVHVYDCTIAVSELQLVDDFKSRLGKHVEVTDLGELHWMLGIEVKCDC